MTGNDRTYAYGLESGNCKKLIGLLKVIWAAVAGVFLISGVVYSAGAAESGPKMVMTSMLPEDSTQGKWMKLIYTEAFRRIGMKMVYKYLPAKRATVESNEGGVDGDLYRAYRYGNFHPDLVRVGETVYIANVSAFATDPAIQLNGWDSLKGTEYRVDYRRGVKLCEYALPEIVPKKRLSVVSLWSHGLRKLVAGWTDIYVDVEDVIMKALKTDKNFDEVRRVGVMEIAPVHAYLHNKHKSLAPKLSSVLKQMKKEGLIEQYRKATEQSDAK